MTKTPLDELIINPNWKENFEKQLEKEKNCKHRFYQVITYHGRKGVIGDYSRGHIICIKCGKRDKLGILERYPTKKELEKKMLLEKFRNPFE